MLIDAKKIRCAFITVQTGFHSRYLLRTQILPRLKKSIEKIVIITRNSEEPYFVEEFKEENIFIERLEVEKANGFIQTHPFQRLLKILRYFVLNGKYEMTAVDDHLSVFIKDNQSKLSFRLYKLPIVLLLVRLLRSSKRFRRLLLWIEEALYTPPLHRELFLKYRPDIIITPSLGNINDNAIAFIMREAKRHHCKVISIILGWDNPSTKGMAACYPDHIITWSDIMKQEFIEYHDFPGDMISVGGVAHFDIYYDQQKLIPRKELFKKFGLDPDMPLILFATKSPRTYPWNPYIIELIAKAILNNEFACPLQLLVRVHPLHFDMRNEASRLRTTLEEYNRLKERYPFILFHFPPILSNQLNFDMPYSDLIDLASFLKESSILVNMFSTMNLEAAIVDTPIINVAFEGDPSRRFQARQSIQYAERMVHIHRIFKTGGFRTAHDPTELINYINNYLKKPELDRENRKKIADHLGGPYEINPGIRIAECILKSSAQLN